MCMSANFIEDLRLKNDPTHMVQADVQWIHCSQTEADHSGSELYIILYEGENLRENFLVSR